MARNNYTARPAGSEINEAKSSEIDRARAGRSGFS